MLYKSYFNLVGATEGQPGYCKEGQTGDDVDGRINRFNFLFSLIFFFKSDINTFQVLFLAVWKKENG